METEPQSRIYNWSNGNIGAMQFVLEIYTKDENIVRGFFILEKLEKCKSIRGTNLYVLWSDLCKKDMNKVELLCNNCPNEILEDACSRQDYSGIELVSQYLIESE